MHPNENYVLELLQDPLALLAGRLLWLLEGRDGAGSAASIDDDVRAAAVFDALLRLDLPGLDRPGGRHGLADRSCACR